MEIFWSASSLLSISHYHSSLLIFWFLWIEKNDAKYWDSYMVPRRIIYMVYDMISFLRTRWLFQAIHWQGDLALAPLFGIFMTSPLSSLYWFFGALDRWDSIRSILMDALRMNLLVVEVLYRTKLDSFFSLWYLHFSRGWAFELY